MGAFSDTDMQVTVVVSWHWPYARKAVALPGEKGSVVTTTDTAYTVRLGKTPLQARTAKAARRVPPGLVRHPVRAGRDPVEDPSSLANNLSTTQILEAARRSAAEGRTIKLSALDPPP